jgi:hypothetical protein
MYSRYGLTTNPFVSEQALDAPPHPLTHFLTVDGFGEQKPLIDRLASEEETRLAALNQNGNPNTSSNSTSSLKRNQFFLIHGNKGTGRTSVSNYIGRVFGGEQTMRVVEDISDSGHKRNLYNWMENFALKADIEGFHEVQSQFDRLGAFPEVTNAKYVRFLRQALNELKAKERRVVAVFEEVQNAELFPLVQDVFDPANVELPDPPLVIFTTTSASISDAFANLRRKPTGPGRINLRETSGQDILEFLARRWEQTSQYQPHPFDDQTIVYAFEKARFPLKRAVEALHYILEEKARTIAEGDNWPNDRTLAIGRDQIALSLFGFINKLD